MTDTTDHWRTLIWHAAALPTFTLSGVRKIVSDVAFQIPWDDLVATKLSYTDLHYTAAKRRQLARNYWDQEEVDAAFEKLMAREGRKDHTSVSIQLRGQAKDSRSQGYCMQNLVISMSRTALEVDVYYRSTELIQKFAADLVFFSEQLPPLFEKLTLKPTRVRFKFANVYLSAVFMPIFLRYEPDPEGFFKLLRQQDPRFFRTCGLATRRFFQETHNYKYRTRIKMFNYWKAHVDPVKVQGLGKMLAGLKGEVTETEEEDE